MRFAILLFVVACTPQSTEPDPCPNCNPPKCPDPSQVVANATCSVAPLVCPTPCNMKCQCWPNDAGATVWVSTTECEGGTPDASGDASDAASDATVDASDASDAGDAD